MVVVAVVVAAVVSKFPGINATIKTFLLSFFVLLYFFFVLWLLLCFVFMVLLMFLFLLCC